jgi:hypothetical protein
MFHELPIGQPAQTLQQPIKQRSIKKPIKKKKPPTSEQQIAPDIK